MTTEVMFICETVCPGQYPTGNVIFMDDGFTYKNGSKIGKWWWSPNFRSVVEGPIKLHTGMWSINKDATKQYEDSIARYVVD